MVSLGVLVTMRAVSTNGFSPSTELGRHFLCDRQLMVSALPASRASAGKFLRANQSLFVISSALAAKDPGTKSEHCNCQPKRIIVKFLCH